MVYLIKSSTVGASCIQCLSSLKLYVIDQSHKSTKVYLSPIPQCTIQNRNVHISVLNGALWDIWTGTCTAYRIYESDLLSQLGTKLPCKTCVTDNQTTGWTLESSVSGQMAFPADDHTRAIKITLDELGRYWLRFCRRQFQMHLRLNENYCIMIKISLKYVPQDLIDNVSLPQVTAWS